jgi:dTMP kinase
MPPGFFITLEGVEGSGKTTHAQILADGLQRTGRKVILTREPGGSRAGEAIRALFLDSSIALDQVAEFLLVLADRAQHVAECLRPALAAGHTVISDRYADSTIAYQGYGRGFEIKLLQQLNALAVDSVQPDLTFVLDCPVELGLERTRSRSLGLPGPTDRFESERLDFHRRVREGFLAIARKEPERVLILDSTRPLDELQAEIWKVTLSRIAAR